MEDIVWVNKEKTGSVAKGDISISKIKGGVSIIVRNGWQDEVTNTGFIRFGFSPNDKNKLYFMPADHKHGWKLSVQNSNTKNLKAQVSDAKVVDGLLRFIGDYKLDVNDDNIFFIDRRNVL